MKNPIREFLKQYNLDSQWVTVPRLEQWADHMDKLLNPWVSVMKNPIREWNKVNAMTAPSYETIDKWADQMDQLLQERGWMSAEEPPKGHTWVLGYNKKGMFVTYWSGEIWLSEGYENPNYWTDLPPPPKASDDG